MPDAQQLQLLRDQYRALHAYKVVGEVAEAQRNDYKIAINDLGANIMRLGLAGAMAAIERLKGKDGRQAVGDLLLQHLAGAGVLGLDSAAGLPNQVRRLPVDDYILATRETLQVAAWLKRAVQATFREPADAQ